MQYKAVISIKSPATEQVGTGEQLKNNELKKRKEKKKHIEKKLNYITMCSNIIALFLCKNSNLPALT